MHPLSRHWIRAVTAALTLAAPLLPARAGLAAQEDMELRHDVTFPESFGFLQTVRPLSDGRVVVADPLGLQLAMADIHAGTLEPLGREGGGPGEWRQPDAVYPLPGDSTLLVDLGNTRLSVIDPDGRIVDSWPMVLESDGVGPMGMEVIQPRGTDAMGRIYFQARGGMRPGGGLDSSLVRRWTPGDEGTTRVAALRPPAVATATSGGRNDREVRMRPVPLAPQDGWAVAADGRVAVVRADPYRVEWIAPDGAVIRGPTLEVRAVEVGDAEKERYLDELESGGLAVSMTDENGVRSMSFRRGGAGGGRQQRASQLRDLEWPETLPAVRENGAIVAPDGRLWVRRFVAAGGPTRYDIFDRAGRRVASASLPAGRRIVGFHGDRVFAVSVDELGLHWLEAYR
ncbi:MAG: hypothetical protein ACOCUW_01315 [Gemmatimonadota bacterium]